MSNHEEEELCVVMEVGAFKDWEINDPTKKKLKKKSIDEIAEEILANADK